MPYITIPDKTPSDLEKVLKNEPYTHIATNKAYTHRNGKRSFLLFAPKLIVVSSVTSLCCFFKAGFLNISISNAGIRKNAPNSSTICSRLSLGKLAKLEKTIHSKNRILLTHFVDFKKYRNRFTQIAPSFVSLIQIIISYFSTKTKHFEKIQIFLFFRGDAQKQHLNEKRKIALAFLIPACIIKLEHLFCFEN